MKRFLIVIVVLGCLFLAADLGVRIAAENAAAKLIEEQIPARVEPEVELGSFPFLLSLLRGSFDEITIDVDKASEGDLVVDDIHLALQDVKLEALEVLAGRGNLFAESLRGSATISEATLNAVLRGQSGEDVKVELREGRVTVSNGAISLPANAIVAGNRILINAGEALGPLELPLPEVLPEVQFSSLRSERGKLILGLIGSRLRIRT